MNILSFLIVGVFGCIVGVIIAMKLYNNYHKELEKSIIYWRCQYEQMNKDANRIADEYEALLKKQKLRG